MSRNWSQYQKDIFSFVETGKGNAIVVAVAGSGKSTTIVEALGRVKGNAIFLAFNKAIAEELKARGVNARTFHSLTYGTVANHLGGAMDGDKLRKLVQTNFTNGNDAFIYGAFCCRLVSLGKQAGVGCLINDTEQTWIDICAYHDLEPEHEDADFKRAIELASDLLRYSNESRNFDFDDMLYIPVKEGLSLPKFDFIFVDEAQDTNAIQRALLKKLFKPSTRMVAVGDPAQAIYGFRGADSDSLHRIAKDFKAITLPLSVSYRCGQNIVKYARKWVSHIEHAEGAHEGIVQEHTKWDLDIFQGNDLVVCRTTRPILALAFRLIKARIPAFVMGREIGQGLKALIRKLKAADVPDLLEKLGRWREREIEKALVKMEEAKIESINDKADCILVLCDDIESIMDLNDAIDNVFANKENAVKLATIHKSKGLEAQRVFWLNRQACPSKWAKQKWQKEQEDNLCYVAATRAIAELHLIEEVV
ncbi:MAG TPA: ATP-dependent helicase [Nitrospira sp.]|nr:ATP-dependent helicase [Nitrospira sp.]